MENVKLLPIKLEPAPIVKDNIENNIDIWLQNEVGMLYQNESQLLKTEDKINKGEFLLGESYYGFTVEADKAKEIIRKMLFTVTGDNIEEDIENMSFCYTPTPKTFFRGHQLWNELLYNSQLFDKLLNVFFKQRTYTHMYKKISTKHIINKLKTTNYKCKYRLGK